MVKFILIKSPDEWATTKQACRDELVVYLFFSPIYIYIYIYIFFFFKRMLPPKWSSHKVEYDMDTVNVYRFGNVQVSLCQSSAQ